MDQRNTNHWYENAIVLLKCQRHFKGTEVLLNASSGLLYSFTWSIMSWDVIAVEAYNFCTTQISLSVILLLFTNAIWIMAQIRTSSSDFGSLCTRSSTASGDSILACSWSSSSSLPKHLLHKEQRQKKSRECCNYNANDGTCRKATVLIPFHWQWNWNAPTFCVSHPAFTDDDQYYQKITMANRMLFDGMLFVAHWFVASACKRSRDEKQSKANRHHDRCVDIYQGFEEVIYRYHLQYFVPTRWLGSKHGPYITKLGNLKNRGGTRWNGCSPHLVTNGHWVEGGRLFVTLKVKKTARGKQKFDTESFAISTSNQKDSLWALLSLFVLCRASRTQKACRRDIKRMKHNKAKNQHV